jgi:hypothetical protein
MYGIEGKFRAFQFDSAVATFGRALNAALDAVEGKNNKAINAKRARLLDVWLERPLKYRSISAPSKPVGPTADAENDIVETFTVTGVVGG